MTLRLDPARRDVRVGQLQRTLSAACAGSRVALRGSLARGEADLYSDIDLTWHVAATRFGVACDELEQTLRRIDVVDSLRWDPDIDAPGRRLAFARFVDDPLFWRIDLEVVAEGDSPTTPAPSGEPWSQTHSALMGAVAAIRALLRGDDATAAHDVSRGFEKIHIPVPVGSVADQILGLVETIYDADDSWALLAARIRDLHREALMEGSADS